MAPSHGRIVDEISPGLAVLELDKILVSPTATALQAMLAIEKGHARIALVVGSDNTLIGTITDGDIRRGLLAGKTLESEVSQFVNKNFFYLMEGEITEESLEILRAELIDRAPVLNTSGRVVDLFVVNDSVKSLGPQNAVVIMAGGQGKRLRPYTENCPKPMLEVNEKPILEHVLEQYISHGFTRFFISVNYLKEHIIDYFGDGSKWSVSINYLIEDKPLGTAGSLKLLEDMKCTEEEPLIVTNGDILSNLNPIHLLEYHHRNNADATICARENLIACQFGVIEACGVELKSITEKPVIRNLVNAGVYVVSTELLQYIARATMLDMPAFLQNVQKSGKRVTVFPMHEYWLDVGAPETLRQAHKEWNQQ